MKEPKAMQEIHQIRLEHYEETKHLSPKDIRERTKAEADALVKKYMLSMKTLAHRDADR